MPVTISTSFHCFLTGAGRTVTQDVSEHLQRQQPQTGAGGGADTVPGPVWLPSRSAGRGLPVKYVLGVCQ